MVLAIPTASLEGKVAVVTGAGRGIGAGIAIDLARRGANVVVNYANSEGDANKVVDQINQLGTGAKGFAIQADVSKISEITRLFEESKAHFGRIDIVMSNSGMESWNKTEEITEEIYDKVFNLNARAQFFVGQAAWKYLEDNGRLILMSSIAAGLLGVKHHSLYNATKMAVIGMTKAFATDFGVRGITVNCVCPGGIKSDMFASNAWHYIPGATPEWPADKIETLMAEHCPLKRCATPEDVARVVSFLASEDGKFISTSPTILSYVIGADLHLQVAGLTARPSPSPVARRSKCILAGIYSFSYDYQLVMNTTRCSKGILDALGFFEGTFWEIFAWVSVDHEKEGFVQCNFERAMMQIAMYENFQKQSNQICQCAFFSAFSHLFRCLSQYAETALRTKRIGNATSRRLVANRDLLDLFSAIA